MKAFFKALGIELWKAIDKSPKSIISAIFALTVAIFGEDNTGEPTSALMRFFVFLTIYVILRFLITMAEVGAKIIANAIRATEAQNDQNQKATTEESGDLRQVSIDHSSSGDS